MASEMINMMFVTTIVVVIIMVTSAQTQRKPNSRNQVQTQERDDFQKNNKRHEEKSAPQSPFTPPHDFAGRELTTKRAETTAASTTTVVVDSKTVQAVQEKQITNTGSPFSPPAKTEWREQNLPLRPATGGNKKQASTSKGKPSQWLDSVEERQRDNVDTIPPLANIDVSDTSKDGSTNIRRRFKGKPKTTLYQEKGHKDIHEVEPGMTPWTRYTDKPRVKEEHAGSGKANARCGHQRYNPRNQICCQGRVVRRHGISPSCCNTEAYDTVFNKCCNGVISVRTNGQSDC